MTVAAEVTIAAPVERVWRALRDRDELRRWHGWDAESLDAEIEQVYFAGAVADDASRTLTMSGTRIEVDEGTTVRFVLTAPSDDPVWEGWYDEIAEGWVTFAQQLRFALERHPGEDRIALYLEEHLDVPVSARPGERYETRGLAGEVWFRSAHQVGLTVDAWNDGLLVVTPRTAVLTGYGAAPVLP